MTKIDLKDFFKDCVVYNFDSDQEWHKLRSKGIGGSEVATILNINKYQTPFELYQIKKGEVKRPDITNAAIDKGNRLEQPLIDVFRALYIDKFDVVDTKRISLKSKKHPFMTANLDGALIDKTTGKKGVLEIKSTTIQNKTMFEDWKEDTIPANYYCQCLHYLNVTGFDFVILFAILDIPWLGEFGQQETRVRIINRNDVLDDLELIEQEVIKFWKRVESKNPPPFLIKTI